MAEGVGEVAMVGIAEIEREFGKIRRAACQSVGRYRCAQTAKVSTQAQTGRAMETAGKMKRGASECPGRIE